MLADPFGHIVWQYGQFGAGDSGPDQLNTPVQATWLGTLNVFGIGNGLLDAPYDAKVVGDYTGLTPPFRFDD